MIHAIIKEMYANSKQHAYEDAAGKLYLNRRNLELGSQLAQYGITAVRGSDGVWYVDAWVGNCCTISTESTPIIRVASSAEEISSPTNNSLC